MCFISSEMGLHHFCGGCWQVHTVTPVSTLRNQEACSWPSYPQPGGDGGEGPAGWLQTHSIPFPAAGISCSRSTPDLRDCYPPSALWPPPPSLESLSPTSPPGKIPAAAHSALRHLSPPFLLLSVFQKCVEIPHLLTPAPLFPYCGFIPFLFLLDHIKGSLGGRGDKYVCSEYVKQIIYMHSAQYLLNKCQLLLKLSPAVVMSWGVWREVWGAGDSGFSQGKEIGK